MTYCNEVYSVCDENNSKFDYEEAGVEPMSLEDFGITKDPLVCIFVTVLSNVSLTVYKLHFLDCIDLYFISSIYLVIMLNLLR